ncbi:hypothetical protein N9C66_00855 [Akkermansiaceae bacterium]|nr:hypothetical protein [Akkermansiaceae bacterium]MDB4572409.1 hypothetical protein [Akkermansiaceae bacterium]
MEDPVDQQRLNDYENRVSGWIGRQGILFQIRYAWTVGSGSIFRHVGEATIKLLLLLMVLGVCAFFGLKRYFRSPGYQDKIAAQITDAMGAEEIEASGFSRNVNSGEFHRLEVKGGAKSFFYEANFAGFSGVFSYLTGVTELWRPSTVRMQKADVRLKAGGDQEEMELGFASVIDSLNGNGISQIRIDDCSFDWGYSKLTFGEVRNTSFKATLQRGGWEVELSGGTFQQNWLGPLEIESAALRIDEKGIEVDSLKLRMDQGSVTLGGRISGPANMPTFDLSGRFAFLPLENFVRIHGISTREYLEGRISGDLAISGSSNRRVELSGLVKLAENDRITVRERWSLLRALSMSIPDSYGTYLRVDFDQGGFAFSTGGGGMKVDRINLTAGKKARLMGGFETRLPTQAEAATALGIELTENFSLDYTDSSAAQQLENDRMRIDSLDDDDGFGVDIDKSLADGKLRVDESKLSGKDLEELRMKREMEIHRITGQLKVAVPAGAFDTSEALLKLYPKDEEGWRWIPVKLADANFMTISDQATELLLRQAKVRASGPEEEN